MAQLVLTAQKQKALKLCKQALGTLQAVITMIGKDIYCPEIIQQADSAIGLLMTVKKELLVGHLDRCLVERLKENKGGTIKELLKIYNLSN